MSLYHQQRLPSVARDLLPAWWAVFRSAARESNARPEGVTCAVWRAYETVVARQPRTTEELVAKVQLSWSEKRTLILWALAGIIGLWYAHRHFFEAFPEASVN